MEKQKCARCGNWESVGFKPSQGDDSSWTCVACITEELHECPSGH